MNHVTSSLRLTTLALAVWSSHLAKASDLIEGAWTHRGQRSIVGDGTDTVITLFRDDDGWHIMFEDTHHPRVGKPDAETETQTRGPFAVTADEHVHQFEVDRRLQIYTYAIARERLVMPAIVELRPGVWSYSSPRNAFLVTCEHDPRKVPVARAEFPESLSDKGYYTFEEAPRGRTWSSAQYLRLLVATDQGHLLEMMRLIFDEHGDPRHERILSTGDRSRREYPVVSYFAEQSVAPLDGTWSIDFEMTEVPPNAGAGAPASKVFVWVDQLGKFGATLQVRDVDGSLACTVTELGTLNDVELRQLKALLADARVWESTSSIFSFPGGGREDGWSGRVQMRVAQDRVKIDFQNHGATTGTPEAIESLDRLQRCIRGLQRFGYAKSAGEAWTNDIGPITVTEPRIRAGHAARIAVDRMEPDRTRLRLDQLKTTRAPLRALPQGEPGERPEWIVSFKDGLGGGWTVRVDGRTGAVLSEE